MTKSFEIETKFAPVDLREVDTDGCFSGYASLFNIADLGRDVVVPGAFGKSLQVRGASGIKMLFQHDPAEPIGVWHDIREDNRGLYVKGRLQPGVRRAEEILALMRAGALDGLSIGYKTIKGRKDARAGTRKLEQVDLWEISIVTFPMLPGARVEQVKAKPFDNGFPTEREFERWLVRDAGLSRSQARTAMRSGFKMLVSSRDAGGGRKPKSALAARIRQAAQHMQISNGVKCEHN